MDFLRCRLDDLVPFVAALDRLVCVRAPPRHWVLGHLTRALERTGLPTKARDLSSARPRYACDPWHGGSPFKPMPREELAAMLICLEELECRRASLVGINCWKHTAIFCGTVCSSWFPALTFLDRYLWEINQGQQRNMEPALIIRLAWQLAGMLDTGRILDSTDENNLLWMGKHTS